MSIIGYCKECEFGIVVEDKLPDWDVFECPNCGHPNSIGDMWYTSEEQYEKAKSLVKENSDE